MARRSRRPYYVNTNFVVDLKDGVREAIVFAQQHRGLLYTSKLTIKEFARKRLAWLAKRVCAQYDIAIVKPRKARVRIRREAALAFAKAGGSSPNTFIDYLHVYTALYTGARYFVTADDATCNRALRAGLCCVNHRTGVLQCP